MKNGSKFNLKLSVITLGVIGLFSVSSAMADDEEIKALTQPKSTVQVEMIGVDQNSAKFGEYNGLYGHPSGAYPNGALNIRGGSAYTNNEQGDTTRWSVTGDNLGLTSRSANASIADQGSWSFGVNFDQLQHNTATGYQTPYQGNVGGSSFTLPSNFYDSANKISSSSNTTNLTPAIKNDFGSMGISNTRENTTLNGVAIVDKSLNFSFDYNHLAQSGAKLSSMASTVNGNVATGISLLPIPINTSTDTLNLAVNWVGENSHITASYFGSFFQNNNNSFQWSPFYSGGTALTSSTPLQTMSLAPSNALNQLNLSGGYDFSSKTKLTGNASISQNTQNVGYAGTYDPFMVNTGTLPSTSLNGLVNTTHADMKLTDQSIKDLALAAFAKYDERDNLTQSNLYQFYSVDGVTTSNKMGYQPNAPVSNKQTQIGASADYRLSKDQRLGLLLANNNINRWCNQYGTTGSVYASSPNCVTATASNENKADLTYKLKAMEDLNLKAVVGYSNRKSSFDNTVYAAMAETPAQVNAGDPKGFYPFFEASRKQYSAKASANWQATESLGFTLGGKYTNDLFYDNTYGVQNGNSWSLNLDGTYAYAEKGTLSAYVTQQNMYRTFTDGGGAKTTTSASWANNLNNNSTTFGLSLKQADLVDGKVTLFGDATYSVANSTYNTSSNTNNPAVTTTANCAAPTTMTCGMLPGIVNNLFMFKLGSSYQLDKNQKIGLMYWYQHLYSNDYYYNGLQMGYTPGALMPTTQTNPSYSVNVISANYTYTFD